MLYRRIIKIVISSVVLPVLILSLVVVSEAGLQATRKRVVGKNVMEERAVQQKGWSGPLNSREYREAEQRLHDLGYWTGKIDGRWDEATRHATISFQKVEGLKPTGRMTRLDYDVLMASGRPVPYEGGPAHIEVDLVRQVLFMVDETGTVTKVLPVSTGSGKAFKSEGWVRDAITPAGRYIIYNKIPGWKKSAMGRLYYPNYILGGIAIHGYPSVPTKPVSHGCIRIPMFAAREFFRLAPKGIDVVIQNGVRPAPALPVPASGEGISKFEPHF